jgi:hypothetical protein
MKTNQEALECIGSLHGTRYRGGRLKVELSNHDGSAPISGPRMMKPQMLSTGRGNKF